MMVFKKLSLLIILEGFLVLSLQILISVLITPYFGNSFSFWVSSLFFTMLGLSLGYLLASLIGKRANGTIETISRILFFLFIYLSFMLATSKSILYNLIDFTDNYFVNLSLAFILFLFIPVLVLGLLPVVVVQLSSKESDEGVNAGSVFSLSSMSGIVGVFLVTFLFLPYFGLQYTILIILLIYCILLYVFNLKNNLKKYNFTLIGIFIFFSLVFINQNIKEQKKIDKIVGNYRLKEVQYGVHSELKVIDNFNQSSRFLFVNNVPQTKAHLTGRSLYSYLYSLSIYSSMKPKESDVLLAGLGGGNLVYELCEQGYALDVVDIDDRLPKIIDAHFLKSNKKKYNYIKSDIRKYFKVNTKKYDNIILDLSYGESVPTNVFTKESFIESKKILKNDGILLIHFLSSLNEDGYIALASIAKTLKAAGYHYKLMNRLNQRHIFDNVIDKSKPNAFIFMASKSEINLEGIKFKVDRDIPKEITPQMNNLFLQINDEKGLILTDDKPILDLIQRKNVLNIRKENINDIKINGIYE